MAGHLAALAAGRDGEHAVVTLIRDEQRAGTVDGDAADAVERRHVIAAVAFGKPSAGPAREWRPAVDDGL